jgi:hypothetical protein
MYSCAHCGAESLLLYLMLFFLSSAAGSMTTSMCRRLVCVSSAAHHWSQAASSDVVFPFIRCRFHDNKYVQEIGVRFYCGAPLVSSSGHRLGTL